jgi:hypothetical protein
MGMNVWLDGRPSQAEIVDGRYQLTLTMDGRQPWTVEVGPATYRVVKIVHFGWIYPFAIFFPAIFASVVLHHLRPEPAGAPEADGEQPQPPEAIP